MGLVPGFLLYTLLLSPQPTHTDDLARAKAMPPGPDRVELIERILAPTGGADLPAGGLEFAFQCFLEEHDAFRAPAGRRIAEAMYAAQPAVWSAFCLEGIARRGGDEERAFEVLSTQLGRAGSAGDRAQLIQRMALVAAGFGRVQRELDLLGAALALGAVDGYQVMGLRALQAGQRSRARCLFRVLAERGLRAPSSQPEAAAWALRGWGLALLPPAAEPLHQTAVCAGPAPDAQRNPLALGH